MLTYEVPGDISTSISEKVYISLLTRIKESKLTQSVTRSLELDFPEHECKGALSIDDVSFLKQMEEGIRQQDNGHYEMPLPFRGKVESKLPNKISKAQKRLRQLKARFEKNPSFFKDYQTFMHDMIDNGYAEKVPSDDLSKTAWYAHIMAYTVQGNQTRSVWSSIVEVAR